VITLAFGKDTIVVGAPGDDTTRVGDYSGKVYIYTAQFGSKSGDWTEQAILTACDSAAYDYFGTSVTISNGCRWSATNR
jgi:hypothetical protein